MTSPIRQAIESGDLSEVGRLYAKQLAEMCKPENPYGGGGVEMQTRKHGSEAREPAANGASHSRSSALPASTPFTPTPSTTTSPSPRLGGVGNYDPNPPSDDDLRAAATFKYGA